jgi:Ser/Thr protein kinase RdoA (MazF antagonist)
MNPLELIMPPSSVLDAYCLKEECTKIERVNTGLINHTWKVITGDKKYILQKVNDLVFKEPKHIAHNIKLITDYPKRSHPGYTFVAPVAANDSSEMIYVRDEGYFRLLPYVEGSHTINVVETPEQAFEAGAQFGKFTRLLSGIDVNDLKITIPSFHDLSLRYTQFKTSLNNGKEERIKQCTKLIKELLEHNEIVVEYNMMKSNPEFKLRVTHHDAKISNVLFDDENKGLCVIDLDTVMPGYFISDVGDMMRTYICPVSEEEKDFEKIEVREEFYAAIVTGYCSEMKHELTTTERGYFFYAAKFMIYMQALRFITDYLNDDVYYGAKYEGHNVVRANNQLVLLKRLLEKESLLSEF